MLPINVRSVLFPESVASFDDRRTHTSRCVKVTWEANLETFNRSLSEETIMLPTTAVATLLSSFRASECVKPRKENWAGTMLFLGRRWQLLANVSESPWPWNRACNPTLDWKWGKNEALRKTFNRRQWRTLRESASHRKGSVEHKAGFRPALCCDTSTSSTTELLLQHCQPLIRCLHPDPLLCNDREWLHRLP